MCISPIYLKGRYVACSKCIECLMLKSSSWAYRIALEASQYASNAILTLTYNEAHLPEKGSLVKRDLQLFIKRLRKQLKDNKVRFFACGEYGKKFSRPHYHIILFNYDFPDKYPFCFDNKKNQLFRSPLLEKCWTLGFSSIGDVTFDSAKYCAKYLQKVPEKSSGLVPPFTLMSRRPGIGAGALKEKWLLTDKVYYNGKTCRLPRYFLDRLEKQGFDVAPVKEKRLKNQISPFLDASGVFDSQKYLEYVFSRRERLSRIFPDLMEKSTLQKNISTFYQKPIDSDKK